MSTPGGAPDAAYRKLLERLFLRNRYGGEPLLLVGELPPEWDIPLPPGSVIVGAQVPVELQAQVVLDVPGNLEEAIAAVEEVLSGQGWSLGPPMPGGRGRGFVPAGAAGPSAERLFCDHQRRRHLRITARPGEGGLADIRLILNSDPDSFDICQAGGGRMHRDPGANFPALIPPPGMSQGGGGGGSSGGSSHIQTTLRGDLSVDDVESHYREQLTAAGWDLIENAASGRWAWSSWDFLDDGGDPWTGLLTVAEPHGQPIVRHVSLLALSARPRNGGGSRSSATYTLMGPA